MAWCCSITYRSTSIPQNSFWISSNNDFFIIDSNTVNGITEKIYGFAITKYGIIDNNNLNYKNRKYIDGCGAYVHIYKSNNEIIITQDDLGSYGIYIYKNKNYFALSNSFFLLVSYLTDSVDITFNRDYANHLILSTLCSVSYSQTMVNEISILDRYAIIHINTDNKSIYINYKSTESQLYSIENYDAIYLLDEWYNKWRYIIKNIYTKNKNLIIALSGGIDSRISFLLALKADIDLNNTMVRSIKDNLHTHVEDYNIAQKIAKFFNFNLNNEKCLDNDYIYYNTNDVFNICLYGKLFFHKQLYIKNIWYKRKRFLLSGNGGETIREYWNMPPHELTNYLSLKTKFYSKYTANELKKSLHKILEDTYKNISKKLGTINDPCEISMNTYLETRCRNHFGKSTVETLFSNTYTLSPLLDPILQKIQKNTKNCTDKNLLISLIFSRYCPELLNFPFEGGRTIDPKTIQYAQQINNRYPLLKTNNNTKNNFLLPKTENRYYSFYNDKKTTLQIEAYIQSIFNSKLFSTYIQNIYNNDIYYIAKQYNKRIQFYPTQEILPLIAIVLLTTLIYSSHQKNTYFLALLESQNFYIPHNSILSPFRASFYLTLFNFIKSKKNSTLIKFFLKLLKKYR